MEECIKIRKLKRPAWVDQVLHQAVQLGLSGWIALEEGFPGHDVAVGPFRFVGPDNIEHLVAQMSAADWLRGYAAGYAARTHEVQQLLDACKRAEGGTVDDTE